MLSSVDKLKRYNKKEKMMVLPEETTSGIHITGSTQVISWMYVCCHMLFLHIIVSLFIEFIPYLFKIPNVRGFLSYTINQDPLRSTLEYNARLENLMRILQCHSLSRTLTQSESSEPSG